jgi:DNA repair exonuclease SbcCD ATPase subunit
MKEIPREKKLEVAQYCILGYPYSDIENRSGVSHGSVVNIAKELECGKLAIPGTPFDQVNDLRRLSLELKKRDLEPSQALLGLLLFDRLRLLEITPELVDKWSELAKKLMPADFPAKDFLEAALRLNELERSEGRPFGTLAEEYVRLKEGVDELKAEVDSLVKNKEELINSARPLRSELESLERTKEKLDNAVKIQAGKLTELKSETKEREEERSRLSGEIKDLQRRKTKLYSEVGGREELLRRLNAIGLSDEDLLRITNFVEKTSKNEGISGSELKKRFFSALDLFKDVSGLENRRKAETQQVNQLIKKESTLAGEIAALDKKKGLLEGEILGTISSTSQKVRDIGEDAASQLQQRVAEIKDQLSTLLADTLKTGEAIGEMRQALKRGEESEKTLSNFIEEVRSSLGRN